jgi:PhnB protein
MTVEYRGFVPYLFYDDAAPALEWYSRVFGFEEIGRWADPAGHVQNAEMRAGNCELWLDGGGRREVPGHPQTWIGVWVDDVDAMYAKVTAAGVAAEPPVDREFGVRMLSVADPLGYLWGFMRRVEPPAAQL